MRLLSVEEKISRISCVVIFSNGPWAMASGAEVPLGPLFRNRNIQNSIVPLENQAQGTNLLTSVESSYMGCPKGSAYRSSNYGFQKVRGGRKTGIASV